MTWFLPEAISLTPRMTSVTNLIALKKSALPMDADPSVAKQTATGQVLPTDWVLLSCKEPRRRPMVTKSNIDVRSYGVVCFSTAPEVLCFPGEKREQTIDA